MLEEERAAHLRIEVMLHEEADSQRRLIAEMGELAGYYADMSRDLSLMPTFFDIPIHTPAASISQTPPPPPPTTRAYTYRTLSSR